MTTSRPVQRTFDERLTCPPGNAFDLSTGADFFRPPDVQKCLPLDAQPEKTANRSQKRWKSEVVCSATEVDSRIHMYKTLKTSTARHSLRVYKKNQSLKAKRFLRVTKTNKQTKQTLSTKTKNQKPRSKRIKRRPGLDLGNASQKRHRREAGVGGHCTSANCENRPQGPDARPQRHHRRR